MNYKIFSINSGNASEPKDIDPKLWDRLVWQQAIEKAIKRRNGKVKDRNQLKQ